MWFVFPALWLFPGNVYQKTFCSQDFSNRKKSICVLGLLPNGKSKGRKKPAETQLGPFPGFNADFFSRHAAQVKQPLTRTGRSSGIAILLGIFAEQLLLWRRYGFTTKSARKNQKPWLQAFSRFIVWETGGLP